MKALYEFSTEQQMRFIEGHLDHGNMTGRTRGTFGDIFFLKQSGQTFAAKCPQISKFGNPEQARAALEKAIYEIENTRIYQRYPGVHGFAPPKLVMGWPFFLSQKRDGSLLDIVAQADASWHLRTLALLIQVAHTLNYCRSLGLVAHQDLKPANILIRQLRLEEMDGIDQERIRGFTTVAYVADFGIADAFKHIGRNSGSRPYMAPEQYEATLLVDGSKIDVFAFGVIIFECFSNGMHPIGERTSDVWPERAEGKSRKWDREDVWKNWARRTKNVTLDARAVDFPTRILNLVENSLAPDPNSRPSMEEVENELWLCLSEFSPEWSEGVRMQIEINFDRVAPPAQPYEWPYMDQSIRELKTFYSGLA